MTVIDLNLLLSLTSAFIMLFLGIIVYYHERKSVSNIVFFAHSLVIAAWSLANYFSLAVEFDQALLLVRLVISLAVPHVFLFFIFVSNFPANKLVIPWRQFILWLSLMFLMMVLSFSPYVFKSLLLQDGKAVPIAGPMMPTFALVFVGFSLWTIGLVVKKFFKSQGIIKKQWAVIGFGLFAAYTLLIFLVFLQVVLFKNTSFVVYSPLFVAPIFISVAYAILRHNLLNVKIIATELFTAGLLIVLFGRIFFARSEMELIMNLIVLASFFIFGIFLIKSVIKEVRQREELARLARSLEDANARLKELDQQKTEFLSIASHQLRTPLSVIKGYIELLKDGGYGKVTKDTVKVLDNMDESNERLVRLIDEYLDVSRIEQGRTKYDFAPKDLNAVIDGVTQELKERAGQKGLRLIWSPVKNGPVVIDEEKIRHVVFNFIDNAIKYSEEGQIKVVARQEDDGIAVRVKDNGIGFDKVDEVNFFQKFYRGNNVKRAEVGGTGLGIFVCKKFIEAHGGRVWAHSPGLGKGSEFGFWIPVKGNVERGMRKEEMVSV